tara:strand:- start:1275 stop:2084 length:810 start_codon:yes stop_codon:yes gene_type:complete
LKKNRRFKYYKVDINNQKKIEKIFKKYKFDFVLNLAAQAGVRYSIDHPRKYVDTNVMGFYNIIENSRKYRIKRLFYASSSSVYGENKKFPLKESERINPKNIYGLSKKINEEVSEIFHRYYNLKCTGLRFFTVFGEWGRPDMMMMKYINSHFKKKIFQLNNFGKHTRDFTYVGDVVKILFLLIRNHKKLKNLDILNICSNKPVKLKSIIELMKKRNIKPLIKKAPLQKADILKTHGNNSKVLKIIKFKKFEKLEVALNRTVDWYQKNYL